MKRKRLSIEYRDMKQTLWIRKQSKVEDTRNNCRWEMNVKRKRAAAENYGKTRQHWVRKAYKFA